MAYLFLSSETKTIHLWSRLFQCGQKQCHLRFDPIPGEAGTSAAPEKKIRGGALISKL